MHNDAVVRGFFARHEPVIITDAQATSGLGGITSEAAALDAFGSMLVQVQQNYTSPLTKASRAAEADGISQKLRNDISTMPLRDYCEHVREHPDTDLLCVEYRTPPDVRDAMSIPTYCHVEGAIEPFVSFLFVANRGNYAHLHFDGDYRHVLLYQVFGAKRVVLIPLSATEKIRPAMNFSRTLLQNMEPDERLHFLRYTGAWDCLIRPGDTLYLPPSIWHYVEYVETGMSVNLRFGRNDTARRFVDSNRNPFYPELHQLLEWLDTGCPPNERARIDEKLWPEVEQVLRAAHPSTEERHRAVQRRYQELLNNVGARVGHPWNYAARCPITDAMAIERYDSPSLRWRDELMLAAPL